MGLFGSSKKKGSGVFDSMIEAAHPISAPLDTFESELTRLINKYSLESLSNTPDFILAYYLKDCIIAYNNVQQRRKEWFAAREEKRQNRESQMSPL